MCPLIVEGLRLLPHLQASAQREPDALGSLIDCETCMQEVTTSDRQHIGCGYEPPPELGVPVRPFIPQSYRGPKPSVCPGFTCTLPPVIEVSRIRLHWKSGNLEAVVPRPTEQLRTAIEQLEIAAGEVERWMMTPKKDGGGGA